jgi:hypothetical protein
VREADFVGKLGGYLVQVIQSLLRDKFKDFGSSDCARRAGSRVTSIMRDRPVPGNEAAMREEIQVNVGHLQQKIRTMFEIMGLELPVLLPPSVNCSVDYYRSQIAQLDRLADIADTVVCHHRGR